MATRIESQRLSVPLMNQRWNEAKANAIQSFAQLTSKKGKPESKLQAIQQNLQIMEQLFDLAQRKQQEISQSSQGFQKTRGYICLSRFITGVFVVGVAALATGAFSDLPVPYLKEVGMVLAVASQVISKYKEKKEAELKKKDDQTIEGAQIKVEESQAICNGILKEQLFIKIMQQVVESFSQGSSRELVDVAGPDNLEKDQRVEAAVNAAILVIQEVEKPVGISINISEAAGHRTISRQPVWKDLFSFSIRKWRAKTPEEESLLSNEA